MQKEALYYQKLPANRVQCLLCPHNCHIGMGQKGNCQVRVNNHGVLYTNVFGELAALALDPIEKKPLYHFFPGKYILSVGTCGCNMHCKFCQNYSISQNISGETFFSRNIQPENLIDLASRQANNIGIAYTYNEPTVFYEYMKETATLAHHAGMKNVMVTNGYINSEPLHAILPLIDAFNVDLKFFHAKPYRSQTGADLLPILETLQTIYKAGKHLEITNLIIPERNDEDELFIAMTQWIATKLSPDIPLHLSRYFPNFLYTEPPTPEETLLRLYNLARKNLHFIYLGNISVKGKSDTECPLCHALLIKRNQYQIKMINLDESGKCKKCGTSVIKYL